MFAICSSALMAATTTFQPKGECFMSERTAILRLVFSGAVAAALALTPLGIKAQEYSDPPSTSGKSSAKSKNSSSPVSTTPDAGGAKGAKGAKGATTREPTKGQLEARERQKKCGEEWRDAKAKGTLEKGITWPKYWSACNKRLKGQAA
jgi:hypothetical protein